MPTWTVTNTPDIDAVILNRVMVSQARHDPHVRTTRLTYDGATGVYTLFVDTGDHERPFSDELYQFLRANDREREVTDLAPYRAYPPGWVNPLRRNIDYQSSARRSLVVDVQPPSFTDRPLTGFTRLIGEDPPQVPPEVARRIVDEYVYGAEGRRQLATSMAQPIMRRMNMASVARSMFPVQQLPDGALPIYTPDHNMDGMEMPVRDEITVLGPDRPDWLEVGVWVRNARTGRVGQVTNVDHVWEGSRGRWTIQVNTDGALEVYDWDLSSWSVAPDPRPDGLPWWERLDPDS